VLRPRLALLLLLALPAAACGRRDVPITAEPAPPARTAPQNTQGQGLPAAKNGVLPPGAADKILPVGAKPVVKLLEPGAEPRADLSYALVKGTTQKMSMSMDMSMAVKTSAQALPAQALPRMTMGLDASTTDKSPAGEFKIDSILSTVGLEPAGAQQEQMARALKPQLEGMKGLTMGYWVNAKGNVRDVKIGVPPGMPPQAQQLLQGMSQSFESMVTPLPNEAVGVGARWQVLTRTASGGADLLQSAIYTLKSRTGTRAVLSVQLTQLAANDTIHAPGMPAGMSAKVKAFNSGGTGTTNVDLKSVVPESGDMALKVGMDIQVVGAGPGGAAEETSVETTTAVRIARP
jgi:hypothetical protein